MIDPFGKSRKIFFKGERVPFDGVPFMIIGSKIFDCQHGPDRKKNEKDKSSKQKVKYKRQLTFISSRNMNKCQKKQLRESSFNMTRKGDEKIRGAPKIFIF